MPLRFDSETDLTPIRFSGSAGYDLFLREGVTLAYGETAVLGTGVKVTLPRDHVGLLRPRSSTFVKLGVMVVEGTIDPDYEGEVKVVVHSLSKEPVKLERGQRICQLVITPFYVGDTAIQHERGEHGFGSTGK